MIFQFLFYNKIVTKRKFMIDIVIVIANLLFYTTFYITDDNVNYDLISFDNRGRTGVDFFNFDYVYNWHILIGNTDFLDLD